LWNLKCSSDTCYHWVVTGRNTRIYSISTVAPKFARFESSWLQHVGSNVKEGVQNMHHWYERTETATEQIGQSWIMHHCSSHSSVASLIAPDQWCMFCTPFLQYFPHAVINWIQIWRIWKTQLRWDKFWSFFCNNSTVACVHWAFQVSQDSVETLFRWGGKRLIILQQIYSGNCVPTFIKIA